MLFKIIKNKLIILETPTSPFFLDTYKEIKEYLKQHPDNNWVMIKAAEAMIRSGKIISEASEKKAEPYFLEAKAYIKKVATKKLSIT